KYCCRGDRSFTARAYHGQESAVAAVELESWSRWLVCGWGRNQRASAAAGCRRRGLRRGRVPQPVLFEGWADARCMGDWQREGRSISRADLFRRSARRASVREEAERDRT